MTKPGPQPISLQPISLQPGSGDGGGSGRAGSGDGGDADSFFDAVGGHATFEALVSGFYARVAVDPVLAPLYEGREFKDAAERLQLFLEQYWGGPRTYSDRRGHPRLRARHVEFRIDRAAHDAWLANMRAALDDVELEPAADQVLWDYLVRSADMLVNAPD